MCYIGYADGTVKTRTRVATSPEDMHISVERQKKSLQAVLDVVKRHGGKDKKPVVELELDLTTMMPHKRTIAGLIFAGLNTISLNLQTSFKSACLGFLDNCRGVE